MNNNEIITKFLNENQFVTSDGESLSDVTVGNIATQLYKLLDEARADERKKFDLHGKLESIIHISDKELRYKLFSEYEKEIEGIE